MDNYRFASELRHMNTNHDPRNGRFTFKRGGRSYPAAADNFVADRSRNRPQASRQGISKQASAYPQYIKPDGTLTEQGERRLAQERKRNAARKKDNQLKEEALMDPQRWVREDLQNYESALKGVGSMIETGKNYESKSRSKIKPTRKKKMDLSKMSDQELQSEINRYLLEERYQDIFNPKSVQVSSGREKLLKTLEVAGAVTSVGLSAIGIAKALNELKHG